MSETPESIEHLHASVPWQAESFRLSAFYPPDTLVLQKTWWTDLTGEQPETINSKPSLGTYQEQGKYGGGVLTLGIQPGRVDWLFSAAPPSEDETDVVLPSLGPLLESLKTFRSFASSWLKLGPSIARLAVGMTLLRRAESRPEAHRALMAFVPGLSIDSEGSSDFLYRINRPRRSAVLHDTDINRLATWSTITLNLMSLTLPEGHQHQRQLWIASRLELDINSAVDNKNIIDRDALPSLFDELITLSLEIAEKGDTL